MCKEKSFIMALTSLYPISSPEPSDLMAAHVSLPSVRNTSRFGRKPGCSGLPSGLRFVVCNIRINGPVSLRFFYWLLLTKYQFFMEFLQQEFKYKKLDWIHFSLEDLFDVIPFASHTQTQGAMQQMRLRLSSELTFLFLSYNLKKIKDILMVKKAETKIRLLY